jgi:PPOX class probable F420-dependent enzyme
MGTNQRRQIVMTEAEIADFVAASRTGTFATIGAGGQPHLVAMWYGVLDGEIWVETKVKSQKVVNLKRNPKVSFLIEDGMTYDSLRGVAFEGVAEIHDDPDTIFAVGVSVWERYNGPYTDDLRPAVDMMMKNRVAVRIRTYRVRSWDHHKLGLPAMPLAGTTAPGATPTT